MVIYDVTEEKNNARAGLKSRLAQQGPYEHNAAYMIRIKLKSVMDDRAFKTGTRITLRDIALSTGISMSTLTRMSNVRGYNVELAAIDALCQYLKCQPGDLLEHVSGSGGTTRHKK